MENKIYEFKVDPKCTDDLQYLNEIVSYWFKYKQSQFTLRIDGVDIHPQIKTEHCQSRNSIHLI